MDSDFLFFFWAQKAWERPRARTSGNSQSSALWSVSQKISQSMNRDAASTAGSGGREVRAPAWSGPAPLAAILASMRAAIWAAMGSIIHPARGLLTPASRPEVMVRYGFAVVEPAGPGRVEEGVGRFAAVEVACGDELTDVERRFVEPVVAGPFRGGGDRCRFGGQRRGPVGGSAPWWRWYQATLTGRNRQASQSGQGTIGRTGSVS